MLVDCIHGIKDIPAQPSMSTSTPQKGFAVLFCIIVLFVGFVYRFCIVFFNN